MYLYRSVTGRGLIALKEKAILVDIFHSIGLESKSSISRKYVSETTVPIKGVFILPKRSVLKKAFQRDSMYISL